MLYLRTVTGTFIFCISERTHGIHLNLAALADQLITEVLLFTRVYAVWHYNKCVLAFLSVIFVVSLRFVLDLRTNYRGLRFIHRIPQGGTAGALYVAILYVITTNSEAGMFLLHYVVKRLVLIH